MDREQTLQFLGAAGTVTGSKHLLKAGRKQVMLDCGLFHGTSTRPTGAFRAEAIDLAKLD